MANWLIETFPLRSTKNFIMSSTFCGVAEIRRVPELVSHSPVVLVDKQGWHSSHSSSKRRRQGLI
jgi:hypothetical protein